MATLQLMPMTTINGTTYATAQLILTTVSPQNQNRKQSQTILPKQEPTSPTPPENGTPTDFQFSRENPTKIKMECAKRRIHFSKKALTHPRPQSVTRRNTRERNRVKAVNQGFVTLANHVPPAMRNKKMSKVDTLKAAIDYIRNLQAALDTDSPLICDVASVDMKSDGGSTCQSLSPASSSAGSDTSPSSPDSPVYSISDINIDIPKYYYPNNAPTTDFSTSPQQQHYNSETVQRHEMDCYQPQPHQPCNNKFYDNYNAASNLNIDFTCGSHQGCPSPTSSYSSDSATYERHRGEITPEVEAELLEFASYFY